MVSNPFANLGVSVQAAKMQTEEADMSLANTLDTLRSTGASAGGATALAQAALQSKKGVSASIEQQEAANEKLKAQGVQQMEQMKMAEAQRLQNIQMSEAQRLQAAEAEGIKFQYGEQENRDMAMLNRLSGQQVQSQSFQQSAKQSQAALYGSAIGAVGSLGGAAIGTMGTGAGAVSGGGGFVNPGSVPATIR
jgi:preprotein translocase subunit SecF